VTDDVSRWLATSSVRPQATPPDLRRLVGALPAVYAEALGRNDPAPDEIAGRQAAVLVLIATDGESGPDVLLQQRAAGLTHHPGQVAFPGGSRERSDAGPVETALREATEETGVDPAGVDPLALLPRLHIPPSRFDVTGVLAHWRRPSVVSAIDLGETEQVRRVPLAELAEPDNRLIVHMDFRWHGPAFLLPGAVVWGYTAEVLATLLRLGGWERPWESGEPVALDAALGRVGQSGSSV
jgi:8-oxo-dGTP pyrophosphatase MutT (NUDIX family)